MKRFVCIAVLLLASTANAQSVKLPAEVKGDPGSFVRVAAETDCAGLQWYAIDSGLNLFPVELLKDTKTAVVTAGAPGRYRLLAYGAKANKASEPAICTIVIGNAPVPPGPTPVPPGPTPPPQPVAGFRAIIVREKMSNETQAQLNVIESPQIRSYLNSKCADGPKGWRKWDKDIDVTYENELWKNLWAAVKPKIMALPALVLVAGTEATVFPLPTTEAEALELLKRYGGV